MREGEQMLYGCGSVDMKSGDAVFLHLAATVAEPACDLTMIFYDCEEIAAEFNGLGRIERDLPEWLEGDLAILGEPSGAWIEAGCQGTLRVRLTVSGTRAHTARAWMGRERDSRSGAGAGAAEQLPAAPGGHRRLRLSRGTVGGAGRRRRGRQRGAGRGDGGREFPLRAGPFARRGDRACAAGVFAAWT